MKKWLMVHIAVMLTAMLCGCQQGLTAVERGNQLQILHKGNGQEPEDLDPHTINGIPEYNIISALLEGLVAEDPVTLRPVPATATHWDVSDDQRTYTFYLRDSARWSNDDPVTAHDFVFAYRRLLSPTLGSPYAYMLHVLENAEAYHHGTIRDVNRVGVHALDDKTLQLALRYPTPYFLSLLNHWTWLPLHPPTLRQFGATEKRGTAWTRPGHFVGNGPFVLKQWDVDQVIIAEKNRAYWDADSVRLQAIHFYPMGNPTTEERAFRAGHLHLTHQLALNKIHAYQSNHSELLRIDPYLATYFYCINVTRPPLDNPNVRRALALAIDREGLVRNVLKGGQKPAYCFTPPNTAGYTCRTAIEGDPEEGRRLLAEAGYPGGKDFPNMELLYNTSENHRTIAQAIQRMWKKNLNIDITLINQEWKVYIQSRRAGDFDLCRFGWTGDYLDPNTFLDMWVSEGGNNAAGWSNTKYDRLIEEAAQSGSPHERYEKFQQAERLLLEALPIIPIYFYTTVYLTQPSVKNWHPTILDHHPYKHVYLEAPMDANRRE